MKKIMLLCLLLFTLPILAQTVTPGPSFPYSVPLLWTDSTTSGVTAYNVWRAPYTTSCPATNLFTNLTSTPLAGTVTTYTDNTVVPGSSYCYFVTATGPTGTSGPSNVDSNVSIPPAPPTGLNATLASNGTTATFAWNQSTTPNISKNVLLCNTKSNPLINERCVGLETKCNVNLTPGPHYCGVVAIGKTGTSGLSNEVALNIK